MKLYIVERSSGQYDDYRTAVITGSTDKSKAEAFAKAASEEALILKEKYEKIWNPIWRADGHLSSEEYDTAAKKTKRLKSKLDPNLDEYSFRDAKYYVVEVEEIK